MLPKTQLAGGGEVTPDHRELKADGQQKGYVVLTADERAKGFVRPLRHQYVHAGIGAQFSGSVLVRRGEHGCGALTKMHTDIAETYARNPNFYSGTFCVGCRTHRPLTEFVWEGTSEVVGS